MKYQTKKITLPCYENLLRVNPIGIWENQGTYFIFKSAFTISLYSQVINVESNEGKAKKYEFKKPLGDLIDLILKDLGFNNSSSMKMLGFLSYDYARNLEKIRGFKNQVELPEFFLIIPESYAILNKDKTELEIFALNGNFPDLEEQKPFHAQAKTDSTDCWTSDLKNFCALTERAQEYISAGDIFQIVLSNQLILNQGYNPYQLYQSLLSRNPSPYHFLLNFGQRYLVGASPETMLKFDPENRKMLMRLIAGTYPKLQSQFSNDPALLLSDEKELAEHMMLVDHCRNDLGRVAEIGSVKVTDLLNVEPLHDVYHLVSQVEAQLKTGLNCYDALESCFPIATLTGTPKIRAMEIISELENRPRGLFGGAVGLFGLDGSADLAVIIRSAILSLDKCEINAGAGIVADSIPEREYEECMWKAEALKDILTNDIADR